MSFDGNLKFFFPSAYPRPVMTARHPHPDMRNHSIASSFIQRPDQRPHSMVMFKTPSRHAIKFELGAFSFVRQ